MRNELRYLDTRGFDKTRPLFTQTIVKGIASGGGLFVPEELPELSISEIYTFSGWPYWRRAAAIFSLFGVDIGSRSHRHTHATGIRRAVG